MICATLRIGSSMVSTVLLLYPQMPSSSPIKIAIGAAISTNDSVCIDGSHCPNTAMYTNESPANKASLIPPKWYPRMATPPVTTVHGRPGNSAHSFSDTKSQLENATMVLTPPSIISRTNSIINNTPAAMLRVISLTSGFCSYSSRSGSYTSISHQSSMRKVTDS